MSEAWHKLFQQSQSHPYQRLVSCLLLLNGVTLHEIETLDAATIDIDAGWLTTPDNRTYPLVTQNIEALQTVEFPLDSTQLRDVCEMFTPHEAAAHRRLSGALWITNDELQIMMETTGSIETPVLPLRFTFPLSIVDLLQPYEQSQVADSARDTLQAAADWLTVHVLTPQQSLIQKITGILRQGSLVFLIASTGVSGLNLVHNVLMGRLLSPADYSQLTFIITLQLLIGLLPSAIQTVAARFTARYQAQHEGASLSLLKARIGRFSWQVGVFAAVVLFALSPLLTSLFQLNGVSLLIPIIIAMPFFIRTGVDRGILQGIGGYFWLSGTYLSEGVIRLVMSVVLGYALLSVGRSLEGTIWGLAQSMLATWFIGWLALRHFRGESSADNSVNTSKFQSDWVRLGGLTALVLIGQALITNSDFLLVKNFFTPEDAGLYAAISVLGRIVYFGALPLTVLLVPLIARRQALDEPTKPILIMLIGGGTLVCGILVVGAALFASTILGLLYGDAYLDAAPLLAPYALAASLYTLTNLVITYQIALGQGSETWMPIAAGIAQIVAVFVFHESLAQVITIQIVLMAALFALVLWRITRTSTKQDTPNDALAVQLDG